MICNKKPLPRGTGAQKNSKMKKEEYSIKQITDAIVRAYEKDAPAIPAKIKELLVDGWTPKGIERFARRAGSINPEAWFILAEHYQNH